MEIGSNKTSPTVKFKNNRLKIFYNNYSMPNITKNKIGKIIICESQFIKSD